MKTGKYPIKLRITSKRISKDYLTVFELTKDEHAKLSASRLTTQLQFVKDKLKDLKKSVRNIYSTIRAL